MGIADPNRIFDTRDLAPGSVEVRLRGGQTDFIVTSPRFDDVNDGGMLTPQDRQSEAGGSGRPLPGRLLADAEDGGTSRITLRLPDRLKPLVEDRARSAGLSVNAWLVRAVAASLDEPGPRPGGQARPIGHGYPGWVR